MLLPQIVSPLSRLISCCLCFEYGTNTFDGSGSRLAVAWIAPGSSWGLGRAMAPATSMRMRRPSSFVKFSFLPGYRYFAPPLF